MLGTLLIIGVLGFLVLVVAALVKPLENLVVMARGILETLNGVRDEAVTSALAQPHDLLAEVLVMLDVSVLEDEALDLYYRIHSYLVAGGFMPGHLCQRCGEVCLRDGEGCNRTPPHMCESCQVDVEIERSCRRGYGGETHS